VLPLRKRQQFEFKNGKEGSIHRKPDKITRAYAQQQKFAIGSVWSSTSGPNGVVIVNHSHVWAADGPSANADASTTSKVKVIQLQNSKLLAEIDTKGVKRAGKLCYDAADHIVLLAISALSARALSPQGLINRSPRHEHFWSALPESGRCRLAFAPAPSTPRLSATPPLGRAQRPQSGYHPAPQLFAGAAHPVDAPDDLAIFILEHVVIVVLDSPSERPLSDTLAVRKYGAAKGEGHG
jgi:hypothetical protein